MTFGTVPARAAIGHDDPEVKSGRRDTTEVVRVAVIGIGSVAEKYIPHLRRLAIKDLPNVIVVACDANEGRRDLALQHP